MGEGTVLIGKLVKVDLCGALHTDPDIKFDGRIGLVVGRDPNVRSWLVLIDGEVTRFNSAFLEVVNETR